MQACTREESECMPMVLDRIRENEHILQKMAVMTHDVHMPQLRKGSPAAIWTSANRDRPGWTDEEAGINGRKDLASPEEWRCAWMQIVMCAPHALAHGRVSAVLLPRAS
jgi:hypothetical protein